MKNFESIDQTFKAMRQLPIEVSFKQIKKWIDELPVIRKQDMPKSKWSYLKSFFPPINDN